MEKYAKVKVVKSKKIVTYVPLKGQWRRAALSFAMGIPAGIIIDRKYRKIRGGPKVLTNERIL